MFLRLEICNYYWWCQQSPFEGSLREFHLHLLHLLVMANISWLVVTWLWLCGHTVFSFLSLNFRYKTYYTSADHLLGLYSLKSLFIESCVKPSSSCSPLKTRLGERIIFLKTPRKEAHTPCEEVRAYSSHWHSLQQSKHQPNSTPWVLTVD